MRARAFHLNLLNPHERLSSSPVRAKFILPVAASIYLAFVLLWVSFLGVQYAITVSQSSSVRSEVKTLESEFGKVELLKKKLANLQADVDQYDFYRHARVERSEMLRRLAFAIPEGVTLTSLSIPPPPVQNLKPPPGSRKPPLQGPTQTVEKVELRLVGTAAIEQDVFDFMDALKGGEFTNSIVIVEQGRNTDDQSPRVVEFRQDAKDASGLASRGVFFDVIYTIRPREFVK